MLELLSSFFSEGLEHKTINGYRSAISAYHEKAERISIGQHLKVCQLLSGIFNKRPSQPKINVIRDVFKVIGYIDTLGNIESLFTKLVTLKLTILLAIAFKENSVIFHFTELKKIKVLHHLN